MAESNDHRRAHRIREPFTVDNPCYVGWTYFIYLTQPLYTGDITNAPVYNDFKVLNVVGMCVLCAPPWCKMHIFFKSKKCHSKPIYPYNFELPFLNECKYLGLIVVKHI